MKALAFSASVLLLCLGLPSPAGAQTAEEVISRLQKKYEQVKSFSAQFDQIFQGHGTELHESGTLMMEKPGKMYWEYQHPTNKFFVADGEKTYFYVPRERQVIISEFDIEDQNMPLLFLLGSGEIQRDFVAELEEEEKALEQGHLLVRLTPRQPASQFSHLVLEISPSSHLIHRLVVVEHIGTRNEYVLRDIRENVRIPDRQFKFEVPAGAEVIAQ